MKITKEYLEQHNACPDGIEWLKEHKLDGKDPYVIALLALEQDKFRYANWLVSRILNVENTVRYAIHAARLVLHIYEENHPHDKRPRKAIEAAEKWLMNNNAHVAVAAAYAAAASDAADDAAYAAARTAAADAYAADAAAYAAYAAARTAATAAYAAARTAAAAAYADDAADEAAYAAARTAVGAAYADDAADPKFNQEIIKFGLDLFETQEKEKLE